MKNKRRWTRAFCKAMAGILALLLTAPGLPVATAAEGGVMEIMPFQDFETNYDASQWDSYNNEAKFPSPANGNGKLGGARTSGGFWGGDWAYPADFAEKLKSTGDDRITKIVILGTMELESRSDGAWNGCAEISLVDSHENAGGEPIQKLFAVQFRNGSNDGRLRSYHSGNNNGDDVNTSRVTTIPFTGDLAAVIDVDAGGESGKATYYYDGTRMKTTAQAWNPTDIPQQPVTLDGTKHIRLSLHDVSTGYFDNVEALAIIGDTAPDVQYQGVTTADGGTLPEEGIGQDDSFALKFDSPIMLGELKDKITINDAIVSMDRISLSADRRSVVIAAPSGGYRNKSLTVAVDNTAIQSYTGGSYSEAIEETVNVYIDTRTRKTNIIPYQDFAKDADEAALLASGVWDKVSNGGTGDVLEAKDGKLVITKSSGVRTLNKEIDLNKVRNGEQMVVLARMQSAEGGGDIKTVLSTYQDSGGKTARMMVEVWRGKNGGGNGIYTGKETRTGENQVSGIEVLADQWHDTAAILTFHRDGMEIPTADVEYYVDGVKTSTGVEKATLINVDGALADQLALDVRNGSGAYDDIEAYLVTPGESGLLPLELAEQPFTDENGTAITSISDDGSFVIRFNNPIIASSAADAVSVNDQAVKTTLTADRRGLVVTAPEDGWTGSGLNIAISADIQGYATEKLGAVSIELPITQPVYGQKQAMAAYDAEGDFKTSDWDFTMNAESGYVVNQDGRMQMKSPDYTTMVAVFKDYPGQFVEAMGNGTEAYLVIRARMTVQSIIQDDAPTHTELRRMAIELTNRTNSGSSPNRRIAWLGVGKGSNEANLYVPAETSGSGSPTRQISGPFDLGEWVQVDIVLHVEDSKNFAGAAATATYYVNGVKAAEIKNCSLGNDVNNINSVRFVAINNVVGAFDYIEAYSVVGGVLPFSYSGMEGGNGSASDAIAPEESVALSFTGDLTEITNGFTENGEAISADRISIAPDGNHVIIAPPVGGWEAQQNYTIRSGRKLTDVLGSKISSAVSDTFRTGGSMLSAAVTSASVSADNAAASVRLRNVNSDTKTVKVIMAAYSETGDTIMMQADNVKLVTLQPNQTITENVNLGGLSADSTVRVFVWEADDSNPVLEEAYTLE